MRIAAIPDVHGHLPALRAVPADLHRRGRDRRVNRGDLASGQPRPEETVDVSMQPAAPVLRGKHQRQRRAGGAAMGDPDRGARAALRLEASAWTIRLLAGPRLGAGWLSRHGAPGDDLANLACATPGGAGPAPPDRIARARGDFDGGVVRCRHRHPLRQARLADGRRRVHPGGIGRQAFHARRACRHAMQRGTPAARYAMLRRKRGARHVDLLAVDYDPSAARQPARERGCDERADALRDGHLPADASPTFPELIPP